MARLKLTELIDSFKFIWEEQYYSGDLELEAGGPRNAIYKDAVENSSIVFTGKGLTFEGDILIGGTVEQIRFVSPEGGTYLTFTAKFKGSKFSDALAGDDALDVFAIALSGNDTIIGSAVGDLLVGDRGKDRLLGGAGQDMLGGGKGNDRLNGGKGSDIFIFSAPGDGNDVIEDFDANGGGNKQDYIGRDGDDTTFRKHRDGDDTILDFGDGNTLTLLNVRPNEISIVDVTLPL